MPLSEHLIHLSDVDDEPHRVIVRVTGATGVHLELRNGRSVNEFTQRELLNDQVKRITSLRGGDELGFYIFFGKKF